VTDNRKARLIAFYLPQFHPIPENDTWWGKGFTEWTNVAKAKQLFKGHYQPRLPADLGFYDLRVRDTRMAQAEMAEQYGIEGFCYWHYWFNGKRLLERPFNEVLKSGEPKLPFCLGWANDSWTGIWHGCADKLLIEQTYPGPKDEEAHFYALLAAFCDERYIKVGGRPIFLIYKPYMLPEPNRFIEHWKNLAVKEGLKEIYFIGNARTMDWVPEKDGFDALTPHNPGLTLHKFFGYWDPPSGFLDKVSLALTKQPFREWKRIRFDMPDIFLYEDYIKYGLPPLRKDFDEYPCVLPNWDNTPRCGSHGQVFHNSTPDLFRTHLREAIKQVAHCEPDKRIVFVKSWNEWAEGNHLEPDMKYGHAYLKVCKEEVFSCMPTKEEKVEYVYHPTVKRESFAESMEELRKKGYSVTSSLVDNTSPAACDKIMKRAENVGLAFSPYRIDVEDFGGYVRKADYKTRYKEYYPGNLTEKSLEHYIALKLLDMNDDDVFIDIASEHSPVAEIYSRLTGANCFSKDIMYEKGIHGNKIGGDACSMPVPDGFASKAILTCSLEHFENDGDTRLFKELARVLKPGGILCVLPFYFYTEAFTLTDPTVSVPANVALDRDCPVICYEDWGNRHGRFYGPQTFLDRIYEPAKETFRFAFHYFRNASEIDKSIYLRFGFTATRV
jgi:SAM-dependent methyltransferase